MYIHRLCLLTHSALLQYVHVVRAVVNDMVHRHRNLILGYTYILLRIRLKYFPELRNDIIICMDM